jgi:CheY-like chemotaxis protein
MDIRCHRCGNLAAPAGHEDGRAFYRCARCDRVWATYISPRLGAYALESTPAPRVLVADDSPEMLGLLSAWLEDEGCLVIAVGSGRDALDASTTYQPDVAFLDVVLPPPDGFQLCDVMTQRNGPAVVLMTGIINPDARRAREVGAVQLLQKPLTRESVVAALTVALARHRLDDRPGARAEVD